MQTEDLGAALAAVLGLPSAVASVADEIRALRDEVESVRRALPPALVGVAEAARATGLSVPTIRRQIRAGRLRATRLGRRVLVDLHDLAPGLHRGEDVGRGPAPRRTGRARW